MNNTVSVKKLANGLTIVSPKTHPHVESIYLELVVRVGARNDSDEFFGLAHFVEHVVAEIAEASIRRHEWINDYMLDTFDAVIDQEKTTYYVGVAKNDSERALQLVLSVLQSPVVTPEIIERNKEIVIEELLEDLDSDTTQATRYFASQYHKDNTLGSYY